MLNDFSILKMIDEDDLLSKWHIINLNFTYDHLINI